MKTGNRTATTAARWAGAASLTVLSAMCTAGRGETTVEGAHTWINDDWLVWSRTDLMDDGITSGFASTPQGPTRGAGPKAWIEVGCEDDDGGAIVFERVPATKTDLDGAGDSAVKVRLRFDREKATTHYLKVGERRRRLEPGSWWTQKTLLWEGVLAQGKQRLAIEVPWYDGERAVYEFQTKGARSGWVVACRALPAVRQAGSCEEITESGTSADGGMMWITCDGWNEYRLEWNGEKEEFEVKRPPW